MASAVRTVEAIYEQGVLRPVEPLEGRPGLIYFITIVDATVVERRADLTGKWRGKYRGILSLSDDFSRQKSAEKFLER